MSERVCPGCKPTCGLRLFCARRRAEHAARNAAPVLLAALSDLTKYMTEARTGLDYRPPDLAAARAAIQSAKV